MFLKIILFFCWMTEAAFPSKITSLASVSSLLSVSVTNVEGAALPRPAPSTNQVAPDAVRG